MAYRADYLTKEVECLKTHSSSGFARGIHPICAPVVMKNR